MVEITFRTQDAFVRRADVHYSLATGYKRSLGRFRASLMVILSAPGRTPKLSTYGGDSHVWPAGWCMVVRWDMPVGRPVWPGRWPGRDSLIFKAAAARAASRGASVRF